MASNNITPELIKANVLRLQEAKATPADIENYVKAASEELKASGLQKKGLGQKVLDAGTSITNFLGGKGVADTLGSEVAKIGKSAEEKAIISSEQPTLKQTLGSAAQLGSTLIPGAGVGARTLAKVGVGAGIGYANDVGSDLQEGKSVGESLKPGVATVVGASLPLLGKITGLADNAKFDKNVANKMEELNMRLTPTEKQNLAKQGKQISSYLADKKIVGTPAQRFAKVDVLSDEMEEKVGKVIAESGVVIPKQTLIEKISEIPEKYADNLSEYDSVVSKVERILKTLQTNFGDEIEAGQLNKIKRNEWKNAYAKNNTDVVNEVSHEVGQIIKEVLDEGVDGLKSLNEEYGKVLTAKRVLFKAATRPQVGLLGKAMFSFHHS